MYVHDPAGNRQTTKQMCFFLRFRLLPSSLDKSNINIYCFQMVRQYSRNEPITRNWLCNAVDWPLPSPKTIMDLVHLESVFDVLELYLWLR